MKKLVLVVILLPFLFIIGCDLSGSADNNPLIGTWFLYESVTLETTIILNADLTYSVTWTGDEPGTESGTYTYTDTTLTLSSDPSSPIPYIIDGDSIDFDSDIYTRQ